jgi:hypothetical protein
MTNRTLVTTVAALIAAAGIGIRPAGAQLPGRGGPQSEPMIRIGFGGGVSVPTSHAADALKSGINGQGYLLLNIGIPIRLNLGYQKFDFKQALLAGSGLSGATATGTSTMMSGVAGITLNLFSLGPLRPYITAGAGAFNLKDELTAAAAGGTQSTSKTHFGVDGGAGLRLKLGRIEAFAEGRLQNVYTDKGVIDTKSITAVPVTFGILF